MGLPSYRVTAETAHASGTTKRFRVYLRVEVVPERKPTVLFTIDSANGEKWDYLLSGSVMEDGCADIGHGHGLLLHICALEDLKELHALIEGTYEHACKMLTRTERTLADVQHMEAVTW